MVDPPYKDVASKVWGVSKKVEGVTKKVGGSGPPDHPSGCALGDTDHVASLLPELTATDYLRLDPDIHWFL